MISLVIDTSVVVKWMFPDPVIEPSAPKALEILHAIKDGRVQVWQPPHWLSEAAAVTTRLAPANVRKSVGLLYALELPVVDDIEVYQRARDLAVSLQQHVFDTLYHAVALIQPNTTLVTADEKYFRKGKSVGHIIRLSALELDQPES